MYLSRDEIIQEVKRGTRADRNTLVISPFQASQVTAVNVGHPMPSYGMAADGYDIRYGRKAKRRIPAPLPISYGHRTFRRRYPVRSFAPAHLGRQDYEEVPAVTCPETGRECFIVPPQEGLCIIAEEWLQIPPWLLATVYNKSTYVRGMNALPNTKINPGWYGYLVLEVLNHTSQPARHYVGDGAATLVFGRVGQGGILSGYEGAYQGQQFEDLSPKSLISEPGEDT